MDTLTALTGALPEDVQACMDSGMNHFVSKPVRKDVLLGAILSMLNGSASGRDEIVTSARPQPVG